MFLTNIGAHLRHQGETKPRERRRAGQGPLSPAGLQDGRNAAAAPAPRAAVSPQRAAARPQPAHRPRAFRLLAALRSRGGGCRGRSPAQTAAAASHSPELRLSPARPPGLTRPPRPAGRVEASALRRGPAPPMGARPPPAERARRGSPPARGSPGSPRTASGPPPRTGPARTWRRRRRRVPPTERTRETRPLP